MSGKLKEMLWLSKIMFSKDREKNISSCLKLKADFKYGNLIRNLIFFKKKETDSVLDNVMGEKNIFNKFIVMDDVLGLADRSKDFANFLTVVQKLNFTCVYVFHTIYPSRSNWQMIISQTKILNIFSSALETTSVAKILSSYCSRYAYEYIPHRDLWISRLYFEISNST